MLLPLYLLAAAVFAMGTSEFMLAGLLPDIAADLGVPVAATGLLNSCFAVGMVVGAPLMAALARGWPPRTSLLVFLFVFSGVHVIAATTENFGVLLLSRATAALANAGFLAVALVVATRLVAADRKGRALGILLSGTTIATVVGVPGGALLGTLTDWRSTFWTVALLSLATGCGLWRGPARLPRQDRAPAPLRRELAVLRRRRLLLVMCLGALVNAATFGAFTFLAPVVTDVARLDAMWVPVVLAVFGLGSFTGVTVAGRLADRRPGAVVAVAGPALLAGWVALGYSAAQPVLLLVLVYTQGTLSFMVGSTLITRVLYEGAAASRMSGSYATAALNIGATLGPVVAGASLSTGLGASGPLWSSAGLVCLALLIAFPVRGSLTTCRERGAAVESQ